MSGQFNCPETTKKGGSRKQPRGLDRRERTGKVKGEEKRPQAAPAQREKRIRELGKGRGKVKSERTKKGKQKETFSNERQKKRDILMIKRNKKVVKSSKTLA